MSATLWAVFGPSTPGAFETVAAQHHRSSTTAGNPIGSHSNVRQQPAYANGNPYTTSTGCSAPETQLVRGVVRDSRAPTTKNGRRPDEQGRPSPGAGSRGFTPSSRGPKSLISPHCQPICATAHKQLAGASQVDYDPTTTVRLYKSTANPEHLAPTSVEERSPQPPGPTTVRPDGLQCRGVRRQAPARPSQS